MKRWTRALAVLGLAATIAAAGCGTSVDMTMSSQSEASGARPAPAPPPAPRATVRLLAQPATAEELRVAYSAVLNEHALLATMATSASLSGETRELEAAEAQLETNAGELSGLVTLIYGDSVGDSFGKFWRLHIGYFLQYTEALGKGDREVAAARAKDLENYSNDLENLLASANQMPVGVVGELVRKHVHNVDHQHANNWQAAFGDLRPALDNMRIISDYLTLGVQVKYGEKFPGDTSSPASKRFTDASSQLQQHVIIGAITTGFVAHGREGEAGLGATALRANASDLAAALGVSASDQTFKNAWERLDADLVLYAQGLEQRLATTSEVADRLDGHAAVIAEALVSSHPTMDEAEVTAMLRTQIVGIRATIDAQAAGDWPAAYTSMSATAAQATALADAIVNDRTVRG